MELPSESLSNCNLKSGGHVSAAGRRKNSVQPSHLKESPSSATWHRSRTIQRREKKPSTNYLTNARSRRRAAPEPEEVGSGSDRHSVWPKARIERDSTQHSNFKQDVGSSSRASLKAHRPTLNESR